MSIAAQYLLSIKTLEVKRAWFFLPQLGLAMLLGALVWLASCSQQSALNVDNPCQVNPCKNGGKCTVVQTPTPENRNKLSYSCSCEPRYSGNDCATDLCASLTCIHGSCAIKERKISSLYIPACKCEPGYTGVNCHIPCNNQSCGQDGATCLSNAECDFYDDYYCVPDTAGRSLQCALPRNLGESCNDHQDCLSTHCTVNDEQALTAGGICDCPPLNYGPNCQYVRSVCEQHGQVILVDDRAYNAYCSCAANYTGKSCEIDVTLSSNIAVYGLDLMAAEPPPSLYLYNGQYYTAQGYVLDFSKIQTYGAQYDFSLFSASSLAAGNDLCTSAAVDNSNWLSYADNGQYIHQVNSSDLNKVVGYLKLKDTEGQLTSCVKLSVPIWYTDNICPRNVNELLLHAEFPETPFMDNLKLKYPNDVAVSGSCLAGYAASKPLLAYCEADGHWRLKDGACTPQDCGALQAPPLPPHAHYENFTSLYTGSAIQAACDAGYSPSPLAPLRGEISCVLGSSAGAVVSWAASYVEGRCLGELGTKCTVNGDCQQVCIQGVCSVPAPLGGACDEAADCALVGGAAVNCNSAGRCGGQGALCTANNTCEQQAALSCLPGATSGQKSCQGRSPVGGLCDDHGDCLSGICIINAGSQVGSCQETGFPCSDTGVNNGCLNNDVCVPGLNSGHFCTTPLVGGRCDDASDCPTGFACGDNYCGGKGAPCLSNSACDTGGFNFLGIKYTCAPLSIGNSEHACRELALPNAPCDPADGEQDCALPQVCAPVAINGPESAFYRCTTVSLGSICESNADCLSANLNLFCSANANDLQHGYCGGRGALCSNNIDCESSAGLVCLPDPRKEQQFCLPPSLPGGPCNEPRDCLDNNCSVNDPRVFTGVCGDIGTSCDASGLNEVCTSGTVCIVSPTNPNQHQCLKPTIGGNCDPGSDEDCGGGGVHCSPAGVCGGSGAICTDNQLCDSNNRLSCIPATPLAPSKVCSTLSVDDGPCDDDADCVSKHCLNGVCKFSQTCNVDHDCTNLNTNFRCVYNTVINTGVCITAPDCGPPPMAPWNTNYVRFSSTYQGSDPATGQITGTCAAGYSGSFSSGKYIKCTLDYNKPVQGLPTGAWQNTFTYPDDNYVCKALSGQNLPCNSNQECVDNYCLNHKCARKYCVNGLSMPVLPANAHYVYPTSGGSYTYVDNVPVALSAACNSGYLESANVYEQLVSSVYCADANIWTGSVTGTCLLATAKGCTLDSECSGTCINGSCAPKQPLTGNCDHDNDCLNTLTGVTCLPKVAKPAGALICSQKCSFYERPSLPKYAYYVEDLTVNPDNGYLAGSVLKVACASMPLPPYVNSLQGSVICQNDGTWLNILSGSCLGEVGAYCDDNIECLGYVEGTHICANGTCTVKEIGGACDQDSDCPASTVCLGTVGNGRCLIPTNRSGCTLSQECASSWCNNGLCQAPTSIDYTAPKKIAIMEDSGPVCVILEDGSLACSANLPGLNTNVYRDDTSRLIEVGAGSRLVCVRNAQKKITCFMPPEWVGVYNMPDGVNGHSIQMAIASYNICALLDDHTVKCWVYNPGAPYNLNNYMPAGLAGVTQISVGSNNACALFSNGTRICWLSNSPDVYTGALCFNILQVSAYGGNLLQNFADLCEQHIENGWSIVYNMQLTRYAYDSYIWRYYSRVSRFQTEDKFSLPNMPGPIRQIHGYEDSFCALDTNRQLACSSLYSLPVPADIQGQVVQFVVGNAKVCAILLDKTVRCFGVLSYTNKTWQVTVPEHVSVCADNSTCGYACVEGYCQDLVSAGGACDPHDDADCVAPAVCENGSCQLLDCGTLPTLPAFLQYMPNTVSYYKPSQQPLRVQCAPGYLIDEPLVSTLVCNRDKTWSGEVKGRCLPAAGTSCNCLSASCMPGLVCAPRDVNTSICTPPSPLGGACKRDSHCAAPFKCSINDCLSSEVGICGGPSTACQNNAYCAKTADLTLSCVPQSATNQAETICKPLALKGDLCNDDADCALSPLNHDTVYCNIKPGESSGVCGGDGALCFKADNDTCLEPAVCLVDPLTKRGKCGEF